MVGTTLAEIREHVESLASQGGPYLVSCGRTGDRPIPVAGKRFENRTLAERAAYAAEQYRAALRRYDPHVPYYDLIVCQDVETRSRTGPNVSAPDSRERRREFDTVAETTPRARNPSRVEFCHRVAASVFEALCGLGHRNVETAVMDVYFELAESVHRPDEFCLCLVESMAVELTHRLTQSEQADVVTDAASRLPPVDEPEDSISATLELLRTRGLLSSYTESASAVDLVEGTRTVVVRLSEYVLSPREGRLPVLPLVLGLYRHGTDWPLSSLRVVEDGACWKLALVQSRDAETTELVSVAIESGM